MSRDTDRGDFFQLVVEHTDERIFLLSSTGSIMLSAAEVDRDAEGTFILDHVAKSHHNRLKRALDEALSSGRPVTCEIKGSLPGDKEAAGWFSCRLSPVLKEGDVKSLLLFAADITERRASELVRKKRQRSRKTRQGERLRALENILTMCAESKQVFFEGQWMDIEDFLWRRYGFRISHSYSPEVAAKLIADVRDAPLPEGPDSKSDR